MAVGWAVCIPSESTAQKAETVGPSTSGLAGSLIGPNYRVSDASMLGGNRGLSPAVAYNDRNNEYLVVWTQREFAGTTNEILGQRLDGTGQRVGDAFQISHTVVIGDELGARSPDVAYAGAGNEYLVVFQSDRLGRERFEIFGQRLSSTGEEIGDDFRISTTMDRSFDPAVTYNTREDEYLVTWYANAALFVVDIDIFGQRIDARTTTFGEIGNDFRISQMSDPVNNRTAIGPDVAYNERDNEYLVVWHSDGGGLPLLTTEVFGQRLASAGDEIGTNDFRISHMSDAGEDRDGFDVSTAYDPAGNRYLVVWTGDGGSRLDDEFEIFGTHLNVNGTLDGAPFQISDTRSLGATAQFPELVYVADDDRYMVVWDAADGTGTSQVRGVEVPAAAPTSGTTFPLSPVGTGRRPTLTHNRLANEVLILWDDGDIVAQRYTTRTGVGTEFADVLIPRSDRLGQNYPNPFRSETTIPVVMARPGRATVLVYDLTGKVVATVLSHVLPAGSHELVWAPERMPSGVYAYRLASPRSQESRLMVLAR